ncbi:nitroreductase family deazaflavin-dependent oxidoreductase [Pseudonocardia lacus]|jgi:deazaflavin-dependent oxidoreductase (nitroreductase family)|uniref:nitroreductase family deazaflavin-dependent oxidoreductase n=1 Tax=Pseudonocardia lacus TaxID=2835865 RepID=UPI001BDC14A4|nr:nitroreductase family deazaflavin-dependent oxidoreductase [Pseudonocardia lacus]
MTTAQRNLVPSRGDRVFNSVMQWVTRRGISVMGSRVLAVRGRSSGQWRTVPVNLLVLDGERYLVAPRGHTQWVRNMRAAGGGELRLGRKVEEFTVEELADADKPPILREYLRKWAWEVGRFFEGVDKGSPDATLLEIAPGFPVFRLVGR